MRNITYYTTLMLYPIGFFFLLGTIEYVIVARSDSEQIERESTPYMNGEPLPVIQVRQDQRPQSIDVPGVTIDQPQESTPQPSAE